MPLATRTTSQSELTAKKSRVERKPSTRKTASTTTTNSDHTHENGTTNGVGVKEVAETNGSNGHSTKANSKRHSIEPTPPVAAAAALATKTQAGRRGKAASQSNLLLDTTNGATGLASTTINEESMSTSDVSTATNTTQNLTVNLTTASVATTASTKFTTLFDPIEPIVRPDRAGLVLSVGENLSNQLGLGSEVDNRKKPQLVRDLPDDVIQIAAGGMHSACLTQDGIVYTFGCNDEFALGRDEDEEIDKVELPEKCIEVTAGDSHTAALSESGHVYAWGTFRDGSGVLGLKQQEAGAKKLEKIEKIAKRPIKLELRDRIVKISSGADHLVCLTSHGEVYTAGNSEHGQLGRISRYNCERGGRRGCDVLLEPGLVRFGFRSRKEELKKFKQFMQIEDVFTTAYCTFLKVKGSDLLIGFGLNNSHQLGVESTENKYQPEVLSEVRFENGARLKKACGGMHHTLFLDTKGRVYGVGSHRYGSLGLGKIDADLSAPRPIPGLTNIVDIAANTNVSYAIDANGKVFSWGTNYSKQLGQDTEEDYFEPTPLVSRNMDVRHIYAVSVGGQHSMFIASEEKPSENKMDQ